MDEFLSSVSILLVLLNPFALSVYLIDVFHQQPPAAVARIVTRASIITFVVFALFAFTGERVFTDVLHVRFAAFQIFGGVVFLLIGIRFMLSGAGALEVLRGPPEHLAGAIAMPFMIGPGTVSASILAGARLEVPTAIGAIGVALVTTVITLLVINAILAHVRERNARLIERYVEITGRVAAVIVGTVAVEMILSGVELWLSHGGGSAFSH